MKKSDAKAIFGFSFPVALVVSMFYEMGYYHYFNIEIDSYLGVDDLTLIFLNKIFLLYYLMLVGSLFLIQIVTAEPKSPSSFMKMKLIGRFTMGYLILILVPVIFIAVVSISPVFRKLFSLVASLFGLFIILIFCFVFIIKPFIDEPDWQKIGVRRWLAAICLAAVLLIGAPYVSGSIDAVNTLGKTVKIIFEDGSSIDSRDKNDLFMVGKTRNYIFLYNRKDSTSYSYKTDKIKSIEYFK